MARPKKQVKLKEPIKIRLKSLADGNKSIYLDIYWKGTRKYEYLKLYLVPEVNPICKEQNKETMAVAERIKAERIKALHGHGVQDWEAVKQGSMLLTGWIKRYCEGGVNIKKSTLHCRVEMLHTVEKSSFATSPIHTSSMASPDPSARTRQAVILECSRLLSTMQSVRASSGTTP